MSQRSTMYLDSANVTSRSASAPGPSGDRAAVDARAHHLRFCVLRVAPG
jgi:hypothetical protein